MKLTKFVIFAVLFFHSAIYSFVQAQNFSFVEEAPIEIGTSFSFQSEVLSENRKILVSLPDNYDTSSKRYPVVYMLDAQYFFEFQYAYGVINTLAFLEEIPEVILVGIHSEDRTRDMTVQSPDNEKGNADKFIEFFKSELQVLIDQQYRTEPYKILVGHSAGGLFALHTLFHAPDTFNGYIALSPALQYDNGKTFQTIKNQLDAGASFNNSLFTSLASEAGGMLEYYEDFLELLSDSSIEGLDFSQQRFPDEGHSSTFMPGIKNGLLVMYENWKPSNSINSLDALLTHYNTLSEHYGYTIEVPVRHASNIGFKLTNEGDHEGALEVFEYNLANISQDAIAHYQVGFALRRLGRLDESLSFLEKAIELGPGTDMFDFYIRFRDEIIEEINN